MREVWAGAWSHTQKQRPCRTAYWLAPGGLRTLLSEDSTQDRHPRDGTAVSEQGSPAYLTNQENVPQANLLGSFSSTEGLSFKMIIVCVTVA